MRVTYDWTQAEWNEAVALATAKRSRGSGVSGMVYALIGIPLVGAVLDGARAIHDSHQLTVAGSVVPLLLLLLFLCLTAGLLISHWGRRKRMAAQVPMPLGKWEAVLQESGWNVHEKFESATIPVDLMAEADEHTLQDPELSASRIAETAARHGSMAAPEAEPATRFVSAVGSEMTRDSDVSNPIPGSGTLHGSDAGFPVPVEPQQSASAVPRLQPWNRLTGSRMGERVMVLLHPEGFVAVPVRCMSPDQAGHLHRMVQRKLRPAPVMQ